jgi:eukaryotic-like serine/threonine-protein kinase
MNARSQLNMAFVAGTRPQFAGETAALLRSRLQAAALVLSILLAVAFVVNLFSDYAPLTLVRVLILAAFAASCAFLWTSRPTSLMQLRCFEAGLFSVLVAQVLLMMGTRIVAFARLEDTVSLVAAEHAYLSGWAILILTYGILMPNSWQRALALLLPTACLPYGLLYWLRWQVPGVSTALQADKLGFVVPMPFVAVLVAVFGAHVITSVRREAFKARQLGQYMLKKKLGAGGMGEVYMAEHQLLKRPCAVKLIRPGKMSDPQALDRFELEVQATARLTHWNTIEIFDYGHAEDGTFYYAMEFLPGLNMEEMITQHGPLPPERAVHFLRQVCHALREAHAKGLIHRDIKPANIIAAERGGVYDVAKLLDFGLVREQAAEKQNATQTESETAGGTPLFMCPEQFRAYDRLDARSDIYSLGAVAYYLVTGRPPFDGDTVQQIIEAHANEPVEPPGSVRPGIPYDLERVIVRCLAKMPTNRYQDMDSVGKALGECACAGKWTDEQAAAWWQEIKTMGP